MGMSVASTINKFLLGDDKEQPTTGAFVIVSGIINHESWMSFGLDPC
jgi:hypothetical protein